MRTSACRGRILACAVLAGCLLVPLRVAAQSTSSSLTGHVRTANGQPVAGAVVQARSNETGRLRSGVSDEGGAYRISLLEPGNWTLVARLADGQLSESRSVQLGLQQTVTLDFTVGSGYAEQVTVTAERPLIDRKQTAGQLRISDQQADTLPLAGRVATDLALLDSSVSTAAPGNYFGERGSVFVVNGQSGRSNSFLVDGLDNNDDVSGTTQNSFFSQLVIREFVLNTHQYRAEYGRAAGGVLNIVTQRGSNKRTWDAFVQGTPDEWGESGSFVDSLPDAGESQDATQRFLAGVSFGGPFKKDKAFYFVAYEHQDADNIVAYTGVTRDGVEGGRARAPALDDSLFVRTDFNLSRSTTLMARLSANDREGNAINVGGVVTPDAGFRIEEQDYQLATALTTVISPRLISESRLLASHSVFDQFASSDLTGVSRPSGIFGGNNLNRQLREEDKLQLVQNFTLSRGAHTMKFGLDVTRSKTGIDVAFNPNGNLIYNTDRPFEPGDCGRGVQTLDLVQLDPSLPDPVQDDGTVIDRFGNPLCTGKPGVDDDGDGLVDEPTNILTYPVVLTLIDGTPSARLEDVRVGLFAQDSWQVGPRLLLDYGVRYDTNSYTLPVSASVPSSIPNGGAGRDTDNIAPRFGFTFTPRADGKLLFRGGAGIFYDKLVLGFPAVAAITSGTRIGLGFIQGFAFEVTEDTIEEEGIDSALGTLLFPDELTMRFSTATELDTPYTVQVNLGVDYAVGSRSAVSANLVRSRGHHTPLMLDLNPVVDQVPLIGVCDPENPIPDDDGVLPCHRDVTTGSISAITTEGESWYWGLSMDYRWRGADTWFSTSYTLSRSEDMGFDPLKGGISLPPNSDDLSLERGRSDGDRRHRFAISGDTQLPFWGLRLSGVLQLQSGLPFNVTTGQDGNLDGLLNDRPDGVRRNSGEDTSLAVINELREEHNETLPAEEQLEPVSSLEEPSFAQVDLRLYRRFPFAEGKWTSSIYLQVFNLLDRENAGLIEGRAISQNFGKVISLSGPPRTFEMGLRFTY